MGEAFKHRSLGQSLDWKIILAYLLLVVFGVVNIYAALHEMESSRLMDFSTRAGKQIIWIGTALVLAVVILFVIPPKLWEGASIPLYFVVLMLLIVVIFVSNDVKGSRSWFSLGPISFQPAEISKISTSLLLAFILSRPGYKMTNFKWLVLTLLAIAVPMATIVLESETGSALVYAGFVFMLYREGLSGWILTCALLVVGVLLLTLVQSPFMAILLPIVVVTLCNAFYAAHISKWLKIYLPVLVFMAFFPKLYSILLDALIPGYALLTDPDLDDRIVSGITGASNWSFLLKIKPEMYLVAAVLLTTPIYLFRAYKDKNLFMAISVGAVLLCIALSFSTQKIFSQLKGYQRDRIEVLLGLKEDRAGVGYNVLQSKIAIGSGGLTGKGFLKGTQTAYGFVPEQETDFIFCTVGEEWGFLGCVLVIGLYVFLIIRLIIDAEKCREHFTRIYGYCVACCLSMHLFINIGMTLGLMPVIGIPLPMMSYGGSSLWAFTILIFIFLALYREERKYF